MAFRLRPFVLRIFIHAVNVILGVTNLYLFIVKFFGVFILSLSIFTSLNKSNTPEILGNYLFSGGVYSALFCSIFLIFLPIWGSIALKRYSRLMLILYVIGIATLIIVTFCAGTSLIVFPAPLQAAVKLEMNKTLYHEYGKRGFITDSWDFVQSFLRCCAVEDNGWGAYNGSWWDLSVNAYFYSVDSRLPETSLFYKRVPKSCCLTLVDPLTGWPTDQYQNVLQCQNWQYGPPRFTNGAHNDALYYRVSSLKNYE
ncbi:Tetraspanin-11 [Echinococcus granulosus]|uniref:Tetraspanin-11 n=1 Tax=Echinococcus granulosus TaxID=6210 RepID=W6UJR7_ECHGR|nr:Tetraspanin-11 [Echinococcus granulosus]EUB61293.1 Tetraspanin-11 [Echinococcus granulosus]